MPCKMINLSSNDDRLLFWGIPNVSDPGGAKSLVRYPPEEERRTLKDSVLMCQVHSAAVPGGAAGRQAGDHVLHAHLLRPRPRHQECPLSPVYLSADGSVPDPEPNPPDPRVFGPSGSISHR